MKITFPVDYNYKTFDNLQVGDVFRRNKNIYMKACPLTGHGGTINTINLETGRFNFTDDSTEVEKLDGEYIVK